MSKKAMLISVAFVVIVFALILVGYFGQERPSNGSPKDGSQNDGSPNDKESEISMPFEAWWTTEWSQDGANANVGYTKAEDGNTLTEVINVGTYYDPYGVRIEGSEVTHRTGKDIYGREQNITIGKIASWRGGTAKPDSILAYGTFVCPAGKEFEEGWFSLSFNVTLQCEYNDRGQLAGGFGDEKFFGHLLTSSGKIAFSGNVTATFDVKDGYVVWLNRTESTKYYCNNKLYADMVTVIIPQSQYLGGEWLPVSWNVKTTTSFADDSHRESEIVVSWQRREDGVSTEKSASGTVTGTEIISGHPTSYSGTITLDYERDSKVGWYKTAYKETRSSNVSLPKRLPFEAIFLDDPYLRPVF